MEHGAPLSLTTKGGDHAMRSLEDLKARSKPALAYPDLIQIARQATVTKAYDDALESLRQICDSEKTQDLARACRFLAIIRRDYGENEFERFVSENKQETKKGENIKMETEAILSQERTVQLWTGERMRVKSSPTDTLWGFKVDDVIFFDRKYSCVHSDGKKAVVLGFGIMRITDIVTSLVYSVEGENFARCAQGPQGIALLERKSLHCRVGDCRISIVDENNERWGGVIKIIDPFTEKCLVECYKKVVPDESDAWGRCWKWVTPDMIRK